MAETSFFQSKKRFTLSFARLVIGLLTMMTIKDCASLMDTGWDTVKAIHKEYLCKHYQTIPLREVEYIGIDEFAIRKGHNYMTIAVDLASGYILFADEGISGESIIPFL